MVIVNYYYLFILAILAKVPLTDNSSTTLQLQVVDYQKAFCYLDHN